MNENEIFRKGKIVWCCLCLWCLLFFPGAVQASRSLSMEQVLIEAELLPDASLQVTERLTVDFSGKWNGFHVTIPKNGNPIKEIKVSENNRPYTIHSGA